MHLATIKHIASKNVNYGNAELYLTFQHDEFNMKPVLDEHGHYVPRESFLYQTLNCGDDDFAIACMKSNLEYGKNNQRGDIKSHHYIKPKWPSTGSPPSDDLRCNCFTVVVILTTTVKIRPQSNNKAKGGENRLVKYYEDPKYNAAFERCIDVMARLMAKYGPAVLRQLEAERNLVTFDMDDFAATTEANVLDRLKAYKHRFEGLQSGIAA